VTVIVSLPVPPVPVQVRVKVEVAESAPVLAVPLVALDPDHAPLAVQLAALVALQVSVDDPPLATVSGLAVSVTTGAGATVTVTLLAADPPVPLHASVYVVVEATVTDWVPLVALPPLQPPEAVQLVALVELQVSVDVAPLATVVGLADSVTVGAGGGVPAVTVTDWLVVPPVPVQANVKVVVELIAAVVAEPLSGLLPVQPPLAVHEVALLLDHVSCVVLPTMTEVGLAVSVTVGAGGAALTVTVALFVTEPPGPEQASVYVVVALRAPVDLVPLVNWPPVHPPDAVQLVASVVLQDNVDAPSLATEAGLAVKFKVGAAVDTVMSTVFAVVPPEPPQVIV